MELTINSINSKRTLIPLRKPAVQNILSNNYASTSVLPGYAEYISRIPFRASFTEEKPYSGEDFLLPKNCEPDIYQIKAADALSRGDNTIVTAPTGTGKTAIAYFIIKKNMDEGKRTFYTAPLKALSNQKYKDLKELFGDENVGILTGDRKENVNAPIVLMTTEIYRNMVAANYFDRKNDQLDNLQTVVFDEFHYMGDPDRGSVWEESIMFTPKKTQILALSATVGNNQRITNWIKDKKGQPTTLVNVPITNRHVPLEFSIIETEEKRYNDDLNAKRRSGRGGRREWRKETEKTSRNPMTIIKTIEKLDNSNKLPAIVFVFSKFFTRNLLDIAENEAAVLTNKEERAAIQNILNRYRFEEGFYSNSLNVDALLKGYAAHSAAILPLEKQLIEELFNKKLIKVVFATETLSAGINMPARTVVLTDCEKPSGDKKGNGHFMRSLMPNEFHQMSGRAGRRGIDNIGYVVCLSESNEKTQLYKSLISSGPNSIQSNFKIDAASVANFYEITTDKGYLDHILDKSFGLYGVPEAERKEKHDGLVKDFEDYSRLLAMYRFIEPTNDGYSTTAKGSLINRIQGRPQIPVIQSIFKQVYKDIDVVDLAGLLAAMTSPLSSDDNKINQGIKILSEENEINLAAINERINEILRNELHIKKDKLDAKNRTNDQIMKYMQDRYGFMLTKSLDELRYEYDMIGKKIKAKVKEFAKKGYKENSAKEIARLQAREKQLKDAININKYYRIVKSLVERRIALQSCASLMPSEYYNVMQDIFSKYNHNVDVLQNQNIRYARLNPTVYQFVSKWAELNSKSQDYKKNWDEICDMLKSTGSVRFEGDIFNAIAQTIDFVHQFETVVGDVMKATDDENLYHECDKLKQKCKKLVKLIKQPPIYSPDEIKN